MHNEIASKLSTLVSGSNPVVNTPATVGDSSITVDANSILEVCRSLKSEGYNVCQCITATDYPDRIELTYVLADFTKNLELLVKANLGRGDGNGNNKETLPKINSVVSVWNGANFLERECYDMMGINFVGHPDLRRILTPDDWQGYPLRRDYIVQEKYLDMVVNPAHKINSADHMFGKNLKVEIGDPKKVSASWKSNDADESTEEAKDGE